MLSVVIGAAVYFIEHEKIDDFVVNLATDAAKEFVTDEVNYINNPAGYATLHQKSMEHLAKGNFVVVEFYDKNKNLAIEISKPGYEAVEKHLNTYKHTFLIADTIQYEKVHIGNEMYVRVITPLKANGLIMGYFEGAYRVEPRIMSDINSRVVFSLVQVVATVFIATIVLYPIIISLHKNLIRYSTDLYNANIGMLEVLGNAIAKRDSDTNAHNYRVTLYSIKLGEALKLNREGMQELIKGAFLHDVGKIGISDSILLKPGKLTEDEFEIMKTHVLHGIEIIKNYGWLQDAANVVSNHHEKYSGTGYMHGLKENEIPITARIFAVTDVFDALTSKRPYKEPFSFRESVEILIQGKENHFDPAIIDAFNKIAATLYKEFSNADESALKKMLRELILKYF